MNFLLKLSVTILATLSLATAAQLGAQNVSPATLDVMPSGQSEPSDAPVKTADASKTVFDATATILTVADLPKRPEPPASRMSLAQYLESELGNKKFHRRAEWAGRSDQFVPVTRGRRIWKPIGNVNYLTVHHAGGVPREHPAKMIRVIYAGHTGNGGRLEAADVGYHFFVDSDGHVWEGRNASKMGTHVGSTPDGLNNPGNLGICGLGSYSHTNPPKAMSEGIIRLCELISEYYGRPIKVRGHGDWFGVNGFKPRGGVDCPGKLSAAVSRANRTIAALHERHDEEPQIMVASQTETREIKPAPTPEQVRVVLASLPIDTHNTADEVAEIQTKHTEIDRIKTVIDLSVTVVGF